MLRVNVKLYTVAQTIQDSGCGAVLVRKILKGSGFNYPEVNKSENEENWKCQKISRSILK